MRRSLTLVFCFLSLLFYLGSRQIEEINCQINNTPCVDTVRDEFADLIGQNFFLTKLQQKTQAIKASRPGWQRVVIKKIPFRAVSIEIITRQPVAYLLIGEKGFLLDSSATFLSEVGTNPGLPEIRADKFKAEMIAKAIETIELLGQYHLDCDYLKIDSEKYLNLILAETEALLPLDDLSFKIASLQIIVFRAKIENKLPRKIDLRFQKPVLTY